MAYARSAEARHCAAPLIPRCQGRWLTRLLTLWLHYSNLHVVPYVGRTTDSYLELSRTRRMAWKWLVARYQSAMRIAWAKPRCGKINRRGFEMIALRGNWE